jgi:hypothetical protein
LVLIAFGIAGIAYGFATDQPRVWASLLHSNFYLLAIALARPILSMHLQFAAEVGWSAVILRIPLSYGSIFTLRLWIFNT